MIAVAVALLTAVAVSVTSAQLAARRTRHHVLGALGHRAEQEPGYLRRPNTVARLAPLRAGVARWRWRHRSPGAEQWSDALRQIGRAVRSGDTLRAAIINLSPWSELPQLEVLARQLSAGADFDHALRTSFDVPAHHEVGLSSHADLVVAVLRVCGRHGGSIAAALDAAATTLTERATAEDERRVSASQARISTQVLSVLPVAVAGWTLATDSRTRNVWFSGAAGLALAVSGISLNAAGWWWMRRIVSSQ
jgi:tight adherence protein B